MLTFALLAAVTTQVEVYAVHGNGPETATAIEAACPSKQGCFNATVGHDYLQRPSGMMRVQDFDGFRAAPASWWPASRADDWKRALASCSALVGEPPYKLEQMPTVVSCGQRAADFLWATWLTELKATRVVIVDLSYEAKENHVSVQAYAFPSTTAVNAGSAFRGSGEKLVRDLVKGAHELKGTPGPLVLVMELGHQSAESVFAKRPVVTGAIAGVKACEAAPARLTLKASGAVAESLKARWEASVGGKAPALDCSLSETSHEEDLGGGGVGGPAAMGAGALGGSGGMKVTVVTEALTCGKVAVSAEVSDTRFSRVPPVDVVSERLVRALLKKFCP